MSGYADIGDILARARMDRSILVADVSAALHIRPRYISALEAGNIEAMPEIAYVRGYITRYAAFLALDVEELLRRFDAASTLHHPTKFFMPHHFSSHKQTSLAVASSSLLFAFFLFTVWLVIIHPNGYYYSLVDRLPQPVIAQNNSITNEVRPQSSCLERQTRYYPPCHLPARKPTQSIMYQLRP